MCMVAKHYFSRMVTIIYINTVNIDTKIQRFLNLLEQQQQQKNHSKTTKNYGSSNAEFWMNQFGDSGTTSFF